MSLNSVLTLLNTNSITNYGDFVLKSGKKSNVYLNFRRLTMYPNLFENICQEMVDLIVKNNLLKIYAEPFINYEPAIYPVPDGATPLATAITTKTKKYLITSKKEHKGYGIDQLVNCDPTLNCNVIIIEDVITTGSSTLKAIQRLQEHAPNIVVTGIVCLVDRRDDPTQLLNGHKVYSLFPFSFIKEYPNIKQSNHALVKLAYFSALRRTRVIASIDVSNFGEMLTIIDAIKDYVCGVKIHHDLYTNFNEYPFYNLRKELVIIEDRKIADIGMIAKRQCEFIAEWADVITVHCIAGPESVKGLESLGLATLLVSEMSSANNLITDEYTNSVYEIANQGSNVIGLISQKKQRDLPGKVFMTPGVHRFINTDSKDQRYRTVKQALENDDNDFIIVGRGIYGYDDTIENIIENAKAYQKE